MLRALAASCLLLIAASLLGGCAMRPLYGTASADGNVPADPRIGHDSRSRHRLGQLIRNDLISSFRPAGSGEPDRYALVINSRSREENAVEEEDSHIARRTVRVNAAFVSEGHLVGQTGLPGQDFLRRFL